MVMKAKVTPEIGVTFYQKRGTQAWDVTFNNDPELKEKELKWYKLSGLYTMVDFYKVSPTIVLLKMELTLAGVLYYTGQTAVNGKTLSPAYFAQHWSLTPAI